MSRGLKKKTQSKLALVLARSLDVGKSGKVKTGTWEAGWSGTGKSERVVEIETNYAKVVEKLKSIDDGLKETDSARRGELPKRRKRLEKGMIGLEHKDVPNTEEEREKMLAAIEEQSKYACNLLRDVNAAVAWSKKKVPEIGYTVPPVITTQSKLTLKSLKVTTTGDGSLKLVRKGEETTAVAFTGAGSGQKFSITSIETDEFRDASIEVSVSVVAPKREITWSPPTSLKSGEKVTIESLQASATGEGGDLVLEPADGVLDPGDAVTLTIKAPGKNGVWTTGEETATVRVTRSDRKITWTLPTDLAIGDVLTPKKVKATLSLGKEDEQDLVITEPKGGVLSHSGDKVAVTLESPETKLYSETSLSGTVSVSKANTIIEWPTPAPVVRNTELSKTQLNATTTPSELAKKLRYSPEMKTKLASVGTATLKAVYNGNSKQLPASKEVRIMVGASQGEVTGTKKMLDGSAWRKPTDDESEALLKSWDEDDGSSATGIKTQATKIMTDVSTMTGEELIDYMDRLVPDSSDRAVQNPNGDHPNQIWKLPNGLQIRYKSKGDKRNPDVPMFCIEGRLSDGFSASQADIAFKVTPDCVPAAKGPGATIVPTDLTTESQREAFISGTCRATHLFCRPKDAQVISWKPEDIEEGEPLGDKQLNARTRGGATVTYECGGSSISAGHKLPKGSHDLRAIATATKRYKAGEKTVTITVVEKAG